MSVSARSYMSAPLAVLTAGVVLSGAALVSAPEAQAEVDCSWDQYDYDGVCYNDVAAAVAVPSYAITQGAILGSDLVAVATSGVAVVATLAPAAVVTVVSGLPLSAAWQVTSVQTVLARFDADWARLQLDWSATFNPANFRNYVAGLAAPDSSDPNPTTCAGTVSDGECFPANGGFPYPYPGYPPIPAAAVALASAFGLLPVESLPADELGVDGDDVTVAGTSSDDGTSVTQTVGGGTSVVALDPAEVSGGSSIAEPVVAGRGARGAVARDVVRGGYQYKNVVGNQGQRSAVRSASALSAPVVQAPASDSAEASDSAPAAKPVSQRSARKAAR